MVTANGYSTHAPAWRLPATPTLLTRFSGSDRVETSVLVSRASFGDKQAKTAVLTAVSIRLSNGVGE